MTQTVRKVKNYIDAATVSIYYHPNNHMAKPKDCRWDYDIIVTKISLESATLPIREEIELENNSERRKELLDELQIICDKAVKGFIWYVTEGEKRGHGSPDLGLSTEERYHASKRDAMSIATSQCC